MPRHTTVDVSKHTDVPIDPQYLDPVRVTVMKEPDGNINIVHDDGVHNKSNKLAWTGVTIFQISGPVRKELGMSACFYAKKMARDIRTKMMRQQNKGRKTVTERNLTADQKALFQEAKCKELRTTFGNLALPLKLVRPEL